MSEQADLPEEYQDIPRAFFRYGTGRYENIILLPQPSDSPNDPLNVSCYEDYSTPEHVAL